jgi:outer membrane biosynthesis protein TonB
MDFLSLEREPEPRAPLFGKTEAIVASIAIHIFIFLMLFWLPSHLPERLRVLLESKPVVVAETNPDAAAKEILTQPHGPEKKPPPRIPLKFTYVKIPNDTPAPKNPDARLLSDKDRRARQEMPTPPDARQFSRDPHSQGDSIDRVKPDPRLAKGPDMPKPAPPAAPKGPDTPSTGQSEGRDAGAGEKAESEDAHIARAQGPPGEIAPASPNGLQPRPGEGTSSGAVPRTTYGGTSGAGGSPGSPARSDSDLKQQTEYKFTFSNQGWLKGGAYGSLSFDTQGFPWGDYARQIYVIIRNNWYDRIPLAAREGGLSGYTCQHFVIARSGSISSLDVTRPSTVPPFNKAASDALHASSPLPPLPADFPDPEEGVTFCFYYNMYPGESD